MGKLLIGLLVAAAVDAQTFEVASIKIHRGEITISVDPMVRGNRVVGTASTLLDMITGAYSVRRDQVSGGPGWVGTDHFDVTAKAPGESVPTQDQARIMMQHLLAERFRLKLHREMRELPIYALIVSRDGPKFKPSKPDATATGFVRGTPDGLHMETTKGTVGKLADQLSFTAGRPVIDKTGLAGFYEYTLDWFPASRVPPEGSTVPSMFVALQEQLGLRLEATTGPQEVLVIDEVARLAEN